MGYKDTIKGLLLEAFEILDSDFFALFISGAIALLSVSWAFRFFLRFFSFSLRTTSSSSKDKDSCGFLCDCEDCKSHETKKFCPRCDRFEVCAYCSCREHCEL